MPLVTIVILNWNGKNYLEKFLPFVIQSTYENFRVVIADNGSTDESLLFLQQYYPQIEIIKFSENHGFAKGYNLALAQLKSDYYILLNSDVKVTAEWIEPMVLLCQNNPFIAACQPKLLSFTQPECFEYAGAAGGWLDHYGYPFAQGRVFDFCETDKGQYDMQTPIFWASGAALFIRASVFHKVGGFDPYFFAHQEEIDLCWRIQLAGYQVYSCPQSVVYHVGGGTLPKGNSLKTFLNFRNNHVMMYKNMYGWRRFYTMCIRVCLDSISAIKGLLSGDGGYFMAVANAHFSFLKWYFVLRRQSIFPKNKKGALQGYWRGNIAWQHFVKGKKKFSEIVKEEV